MKSCVIKINYVIEENTPQCLQFSKLGSFQVILIALMLTSETASRPTQVSLITRPMLAHTSFFPKNEGFNHTERFGGSGGENRSKGQGADI